jgi:hypothetical protein
MATPTKSAFDPFVLLNEPNDRNVAVPETPLRRLNYFDGKFLRSSDLQLEQRYLRSLIDYSNQAGGSGVVHGYSVGLAAGDGLRIGSGLAIDGLGRVLLLNSERTVSIARLIEQSRQAVYIRKRAGHPIGFADCEIVKDLAVVQPAQAAEAYVVSIAFVEALCGEEDVYGKICEQACVTDTARPYWVEGVVVRARPLVLSTPLKKYAAVPVALQHLRSRMASAYFADEAGRVPDFISATGLENGAWCAGAEADNPGEVDIAVIGRRGAATLFLDPWMVRRERIETPPRRYWAWRMRMRPWDVFLAQVLQFQCQLAGMLGKGSVPIYEFDPCDDQRQLINKAARSMTTFKNAYLKAGGVEKNFIEALKLPDIAGGVELSKHFQELLDFEQQFKAIGRRKKFLRSSRILIDGGIVELPSAGYLPVDPHGRESIQGQVRRLMGEGVDLRFCAVTADFVAHALEEAQHMDRIDLIQGIADPRPEIRPDLDILVPDATIERRPLMLGRGFEFGAYAFDTLLQAKKGQFFPAVEVGGAKMAVDENFRVVVPGAAAKIELDGVMDERLELVRQIITRGGRLTGVARTDPLETGGGTFHLAGASDDRLRRATMFHSALDMMEVMVKAREAEPEAERSMFTGAKAAMEEVLARPAAGERRERAAAAVRPVIGRNEGDIIERDDASRVSLWSSARVPRNPFTMRAAQQTTIALRVVLGRSDENAAAVDLRLDGTLTLEADPTTTGRVRSVYVDIEGRSHIEITKADGVSVGFGGPVKTRVKLEWYDDGNRQGIKATLASGKQARIVGLVVLPSIMDAEADAELLLGIDTADGTVYFGGAEFREDADVFRAGNSFHDLAVRAIDFIGNALQDATFAAEAKKALFAPATDESEDIIHAVRDWVLFHRRRVKDCGGTISVARPEPPKRPPPPVVRPMQYAVYDIQLGPNDVAKVATALKAGTGTMQLTKARYVGNVQFGQDDEALQASSRAAFPPLWANLNPGKVLYGGVIASTGDAADNGPLSVGRLESLAQITDPPSTPAPAPIWRMLPSPISDFNPRGGDGVIILFTLKSDPITWTNEVILIKARGDAILDEIQEEGFGGGRYNGGLTAPLGVVHFTDDVIDMTDLGRVAAQLTAQGGVRDVLKVVVVSQQATAAALVPQAQRIIRELGGAVGIPVSSVQLTLAQGAPPSPVVTLLLKK